MKSLNRFFGFNFEFFVNNIRLYLILVFLLVFGLTVAAQKTMTGYITDSISGEPISFASVYIKSSGTGTQSDDNGRFMLKQPSVSTDIVVSAIGYVEKTVRFSPCK